MSLQAHTRPSVQAEIYLRISRKLKRERLKRKENVLFVPLNASLEVAPCNRFFFFGFTEICTMGCVYSTIIGSIIYIQTKLLDVCFSTLVCSIIYIQSTLLVVTILI